MSVKAEAASNKFELNLSVSVVLAAKESSGGPELDVNEVSTIGIIGAVIVLGVLVLAGVLDDSIKGNTILGDSDHPVSIVVSPVTHARMLGIKEGDDRGVLYLMSTESFTISELSSPFAAIVVTAFSLIWGAAIFATSGV